MKYLLDTNIIISLTMNRHANVVRRAAMCEEGDMVTSVIAYAEVAFGSHRGQPPDLFQVETGFSFWFYSKWKAAESIPFLCR